MSNTIGSCSLCGGRVSTIDEHFPISQPTARCETCGAQPMSQYGPMIPMTPDPNRQAWLGRVSKFNEGSLTREGEAEKYRSEMMAHVDSLKDVRVNNLSDLAQNRNADRRNRPQPGDRECPTCHCVWNAKPEFSIGGTPGACCADSLNLPRYTGMLAYGVQP
jgi:hypothetical protein